MKVIYCTAPKGDVAFLFNKLDDDGRYDTKAIHITEEQGNEGECTVSVSKVNNDVFIVRQYTLGSYQYTESWVGRVINKKVNKQVLDMVQSSDQESVILGMGMLKQLLC